MYNKLSDNQKEAVDYEGGHLLILAGAGSGKTRVLTERIRRRINELKTGEKLIAITFTNKAAEELKERLIKTLSLETINDKIFVGTIHNFCLDIVLTRGNSIGLPSELHIFESENDRLKIFGEVILNIPTFKKKSLNMDQKELNKQICKIFYQISSVKKNLKFYYDYKEDSLPYMILKNYEQALLSQNVIDFDDILNYSYKILNSNPHILNLYQRVYKSIYVDEAQDLNKSQYEIIKILSGESMDITMVGDVSQSIYGFNASSNKFFSQNFINDFKVKTIELFENFRSSKSVIEAAKKLDDNFNIKSFWPIDGEFQIFSFTDETKEAEWIIDKILYLKEHGHGDIEEQKIGNQQIAILGRNKYVFKKIEDLLKTNCIPYNLKVSNANTFICESSFMKAFELGLKVVVNNNDKFHLRELQFLLKINDNINSIKDIEEYKSFDKYWESLISVLCTSLNNLESNSIGFNFSKILFDLSSKIETIDKLIDEEKELINNDISYLLEIWNVYVRKSDASNRTLSNFIRSRALGQTQIDDKEGITLSTVHMSKGLEYDVLFIVGVVDGTFPDYRATEEEELEEEKHNMFVAITRAKRLCYITYPLKKENYRGDIINTKISCFIKELLK